MTGNATVGYFALGYGSKSAGLAGATVSSPQDAMTGAVNPAGYAFIGERYDLSLKVFNPRRRAYLDPQVLGAQYRVEDTSARNWFFIPGGGLSIPLNDKLWFGLTLYANGGLNTSYKRNLFDETSVLLGALRQGGPAALASIPKNSQSGIANSGRLGVDLAQLLLTPSLSFKINDNHSLGISALIGIQYFKAYGLGPSQCFTQQATSQNPIACSPQGAGAFTPGFNGSDHFTDNNLEWSYGAGVRVGWIGQVHPRVTLGASYSSKVFMTKLNEYHDLFADNGSFDMPQQVQAGITLKLFEPIRLSFDYQRIFYGDIDAIANPGPIGTASGPQLPEGFGLLGRKNGLGFGWRDINIYRVGLQYNLNEHLTFRAGYSWNESPIPDHELTFNILATASITRHATFGMSYQIDNSSELNFSYVHAFHEAQDSQNSAFGIPVGFSMHQHSFELGYSWKF